MRKQTYGVVCMYVEGAILTSQRDRMDGFVSSVSRVCIDVGFCALSGWLSVVVVGAR